MIQESEYNIYPALTKKERFHKRKSLHFFLKYLTECKSIADLGCGDGVFLELLISIGKKAIGVDISDEMLAVCKSFNLPVIKCDILKFMRNEAKAYDAFILLDLVEHLDFKTNLEILKNVPERGIVIIKTPNVNSILGHQLYLQLPSHIKPYAPAVLSRMLQRTDFTIINHGEIDYPFGHFGKRLKNLMKKLLFVYSDIVDIVLGGGNYFVVARKQHK
jgi:SAM-dependent methyltransferase